jgi:preprotein translocase subunit YajC
MTDNIKISDEGTVATTSTTQATESPSKGIFANETLMNILPIVLIFVVFYFFIIRPQIKKQKDQEALVKSSKKGDKVIVAGGIIGTITQEKENDIVMLEISKGVQIEVLRSSIMTIVSAHQPKKK